MEFSEAAAFLQENRLAVVTTVGPSGRAQSTVVGAAPHEGKIVFVTRGSTVKMKNLRRNGRCTVTVIKPDTRRYVTVEGPATAHGWDDSDSQEHLALLANAYASLGRRVGTPDEFARAMREEQRAVVLVTPERVYGSLT